MFSHTPHNIWSHASTHKAGDAAVSQQTHAERQNGGEEGDDDVAVERVSRDTKLKHAT